MPIISNAVERTMNVRQREPFTAHPYVPATPLFHGGRARSVLLMLAGLLLLLVAWPLSPSPQTIRHPLSPPLLPGPRHSRHTLVFHGSDLTIEAEAGPKWYTVWVEVDGRPANALPHDERGRAYLNLYQPVERTMRVPVARGLSPGEHTVTFIGGPGDPIWPITALVEGGRGQTRTPFAFLGLSFLLTGAMALTGNARGGQIADAVTGPDRILRWMLPLTAFTVPFATWYVRVGHTTIVVTEIALLITGSAKLLHLLTSRLLSTQNRRGQFPPLRKEPGEDAKILTWFPPATVVAALLLSLARGDLRLVVVGLKGGVLFPLVLGMFVWHSTMPTRKNVARTLALGATALALIALADLFTGRAVWVNGLPRVRGHLGSPNHLALILVRALPFALLLPHLTVAGEKVTSRKGSDDNRPARVLLYAPAALILLALLLTASRGAWLLGVPGVLLVLWAERGSRVGRTKMARWGVPLVGVAGSLVLARGTSTWRQRWLIWQGVWRMIQAHPWVGIGPGRFPVTYPQYALPSAWREPLLYHAHNTILNTMVVLGIPATVAAAYLLARVMLRRARGPVALAARASLWGGLAFGMVDAFWALPDLAYLTALAVALLMPPPEAPGAATDHSPR